MDSYKNLYCYCVKHNLKCYTQNSKKLTYNKIRNIVTQHRNKSKCNTNYLYDVIKSYICDEITLTELNEIMLSYVIS